VGASIQPTEAEMAAVAVHELVQGRDQDFLFGNTMIQQAEARMAEIRGRKRKWGVWGGGQDSKTLTTSNGSRGLTL